MSARGTLDTDVTTDPLVVATLRLAPGGLRVLLFATAGVSETTMTLELIAGE